MCQDLALSGIPVAESVAASFAGQFSRYRDDFFSAAYLALVRVTRNAGLRAETASQYIGVACRNACLDVIRRERKAAKIGAREDVILDSIPARPSDPTLSVVARLVDHLEPDDREFVLDSLLSSKAPGTPAMTIRESNVRKWRKKRVLAQLKKVAKREGVEV